MKKIIWLAVLIVFITSGCSSIKTVEDSYLGTRQYISKELLIMNITFTTERYLYLWVEYANDSFFIKGKYKAYPPFTTNNISSALIRDSMGVEYTALYIGSPIQSQSVSSFTNEYTGTQTYVTNWASINFSMALTDEIPEVEDIRILIDGGYDNFEISDKNMAKLKGWYNEIWDIVN